MRHCKSCCTECGEHFTGDRAFDAHRAGSFRDGSRYCEYPEDVRRKNGQPMFVASASEGVCEISGPTVKVGVILWQLAADAERPNPFAQARAAAA